MAVTTVFAGSADADLLSSNASYTTAAAGSGVTTPVNSANELWIGQLLFGTYSIYESFVGFDLSGLGVGQTVSSAVMQTYLITDASTDRDFYCIAQLYDWGASVAAADWQDQSELVALGTWWTHLQTAGIGAAGSYKSWADTTDMRALVQLFAGSTLRLVLSSQYTFGGFAPAGAEYMTFSSTDVGGTTQDPKLVITHERELANVTMSGGLILGGEATIETVPLANVTGSGGAILGGEADVEYVHGSGAVAPEVVVEWDFGTGWEDVTPLCLKLEVAKGLDAPSRLSHASGGMFKATFNNDDNLFNRNNALSPYNQGGMTVKPGRPIRVRTAESVPDDPVLLARDRFDRSDSATLGTADTGQVWTNQLASGWTIVGEVAQAADVTGQFNIATIDVGTPDVYVQGSLRQFTENRRVGLVVSFTDADNYVYAYADSNPALGVRLAQRVAGVGNTIGVAYPMTSYEGMILGISKIGNACVLYVNGVEVASGNATAPATDLVGLYAFHLGSTGREPEIDDFYVYDKVRAEVDGILWTGKVTHIDPGVTVGPRRLASIEGAGALADLARPTVAAPRAARSGYPTGMMIGDVLAKAQLLHPPVPLDIGTVTTGPVALEPDRGLYLARQFETVERGTIFETNEGGIGFADADARDSAVSQVLFSDHPGWQFGYTELELIDRQSEIVNRVIANVAADAPSIPTFTTRTSGVSVTPDVDIVLPTTAAGDLLVVFIASTVNELHDWLTPTFWANHRELKSALGLRVYSHFCDGTESGDTIRFYDNVTPVNGFWVANIVRIPNWFESYNRGIAMSDPAQGDDPNAVLHGWGRDPTLYLVTRAGMASTTGTTWTTNVDPPDGYTGVYGTRLSNGVDVGFDVGIATGWAIDVTPVENPSAYEVHTGFDVVDETVVFAVRGYNGPHTKDSLTNPGTTGGEGRQQVVDDTDSQDEIGAVQTLETARLFADETDALAFGLLTVAGHGDSSPGLRLAFPATKSDHYREQAYLRRLGDMITVQADDPDRAGFGLTGDYFIEHITHSFPGPLEWWVSWELSPA